MLKTEEMAVSGGEVISVDATGETTYTMDLKAGTYRLYKTGSNPVSIKSVAYTYFEDEQTTETPSHAPTATPTTELVADVQIDGGIYTITADAGALNGTLVIAAYEKDRLIAMQSEE